MMDKNSFATQLPHLITYLGTQQDLLFQGDYGHIKTDVAVEPLPCEACWKVYGGHFDHLGVVFLSQQSITVMKSFGLSEEKCLDGAQI